MVKNPAANAGDARDLGSIPGSKRSSGVGNGNPQYSCLENSMDRGDWRATVHRVAKSLTGLRDWRQAKSQCLSLLSSFQLRRKPAITLLTPMTFLLLTHLR